MAIIAHASHGKFTARGLIRAGLLSAVILLCVLLSVVHSHQTRSKITRPGGGFSAQPTWSQDFSSMPDGPLDNAVWRYELNPDVPGYNHEVQGYTNDMRNARIESGKLVIEAHREPYTYPHDPLHRQFEITSAFIDTKNSLNFEYGKFEVTMRMPKGEGTWPAFWFLSVNQPYTRKLHPSDKDLMNERYALHDGELDGVEAYGSQPGVIESTVHSFDKTTQKQITVADAEEVFHTYGVEIRPDRLVWTLDGEPYYNIQKSSNNPNEWPFGNGNRFYAILNLAMGGTGGGPVNPADSDWRLEIAAAKFYKYINR